jgi:hypothetical protein
MIRSQFLRLDAQHLLASQAGKLELQAGHINNKEKLIIGLRKFLEFQYQGIMPVDALEANRQIGFNEPEIYFVWPVFVSHELFNLTVTSKNRKNTH